MDALDLIENLQNVDLKKAGREALQKNAEVIADLNASQLAMGLRATGTAIKPAYHPLTIEIKKGLSGLAAVTDHVTLYNTGDHYRALYMEVKGDEIEYGSHDEKSEKLQEKYGKTIYGLTDDSKDELVEGHLRGDFLENIHEQTGL